MNLRSGKVVGANSENSKDKDNPDVIVIRPKNLDEDFWEKCPVCYKQNIDACGCDATASECWNGHHWHFHQYYSTKEWIKVFHRDGLEKYPCPHNSRVGTHACHC